MDVEVVGNSAHRRDIEAKQSAAYVSNVSKAQHRATTVFRKQIKVNAPTAAKAQMA
ncbi:MAG: hypothetical protein Q9201_007785 [Fulgogasparrea decipioides]